MHYRLKKIIFRTYLLYMILLTVLLSTYILAINFYAFRLLRKQRDDTDIGELNIGDGDGKLLLVSAMGGAITIFASMFAFRYRLDSMLLMLVLPLLAAVNIYCFYLGYRSIFIFW